MSDETKSPNAGVIQITKHSDVGLALAVVGMLVVLVIPLPTAVLDMLLTINIAFAMIVLLVTLNAGEPLDFSTFPSLLLFSTLFRLSLNVASTRLILLDGSAGQVICAFGNFVVGGSLVVGLVIFLILVVIQFVVITKGSGRISEVAARFNLDAMPGKQMAIDADLNAGLITENQARERRESVSREAEFYGAMDGASKFVRGDAIAGIIITVVNILGGMFIGVVQDGRSLSEALQTYSILTVGDGLVSQIPSLVIATAAGILVTKASSRTKLAGDMSAQLLTQPRALAIAASILTLMGVIPGLPHLPFFLMAGTLFAMYSFMNRAERAAATQAAQAGLSGPVPDSGQLPEGMPPGGDGAHQEPEDVAGLIQVDRMSIEIGYRLIPLVDPKEGGALLERIGMVRRQMAKKLGIVIPPIRIKDDIQLEPDTYCVKIRGQVVASAELLAGHFLAMDSGMVTEPIAGIDTIEPAFQLPALWIKPEQKEAAQVAGYTVIDPTSVVITHLQELIKAHAHEILCREDVQLLVDNAKKTAPTVVGELVPEQLSLAGVQRVLENLLRERVPISDMPVILETVADYAPLTKDPQLLTEYVRQKLARTITGELIGASNKLSVIIFDQSLEREIVEAGKDSPSGPVVALEPTRTEAILNSISRIFEGSLTSAYDVVMLTNAASRRFVRSLLETALPTVPVISYDELIPTVNIESVGTVAIANDA